MSKEKMLEAIRLRKLSQETYDKACDLMDEYYGQQDEVSDSFMLELVEAFGEPIFTKIEVDGRDRVREIAEYEHFNVIKGISYFGSWAPKWSFHLDKKVQVPYAYATADSASEAKDSLIKLIRKDFDRMEVIRNARLYVLDELEGK